MQAGRQAYVVCPLVAESERRDLKAAVQTHAELAAGPFHDFRVGLLHGKLDDKAKLQVMERFQARQLDVLVSTVAVEVGIDVPNATVMILEHAERFGLSQLHQLRGASAAENTPASATYSPIRKVMKPVKGFGFSLVLPTGSSWRSTTWLCEAPANSSGRVSTGRAHCDLATWSPIGSSWSWRERTLSTWSAEIRG